MADIPTTQLAEHRASGALDDEYSIRLLWIGPFDPASLQGLPRLEWLSISEMIGPADLSLLDGLEGLRHLTLFAAPERSDLNDLPALSGLQELSVLNAHGLTDLSGLARVPSLKSISLQSARALADLGPLAGLTELTRVAISWSIGLWDLSPLAALAGLEVLDLTACRYARDLSPLSGLEALWKLDLSATAGQLDLSPLAGCPALRELQVNEDAILQGLHSLRGLTGLTAGLKIDKNGWPKQSRSRLKGNALLLALSVDSEDLAGARRLSFRNCRSITDLSRASRITGAEVLDLRGCGALTAAWEVLEMPALTSLDLGKCRALDPQPDRKLMEGQAAIDAYRRKLARSLEQLPARTPRQEALLDGARAAGLLARVQVTAEQRDQAATAKQIRKMLAARDLDAVRQGMDLLRALDDPEIAADLASGVSLVGAKATVSKAAARRPHLRPRDRRQWVATALLRLTGGLDAAEHLAFVGWRSMLDLTPFEGLTALRSLQIMSGVGLTDLSPLAGLTGLEVLYLGDVRDLEDLTPLAGLTALRRLTIQTRKPLSLAPLAGLLSLEALELAGFLRDEELIHLAPLAGAGQLTELDLSRCSGASDTHHRLFEGRAAIQSVLSR